MGKKIITILILGLFLIVIQADAQSVQRNIALFRAELKNKELSSILDSMIAEEKKCSYYTPSIAFGIDINKEKDGFEIVLTSENMNMLLSLAPYGYFYHQKHLFFLRVDKCDDLFLICKDKKKFKFKDEKLEFLDDSFSAWSYFYVNKKFVLNSKSSCGL